MKKNSTPQPSEREIQNSILEYLQYLKIFSWRNNSIGIYDVKSKTFRSRPKFVIKGVSDILGILPDGRFLAIEVKAKYGVVSAEQQLFLDRINKNGGIGFIARSLDDVSSKL